MKFVTHFKEDFVQLDILGDNINDYFVEFKDLNTNNIEYTTTIKNNSWSKLNNVLNKNIQISVYKNNELIFKRTKSDKFNKVYIKFGSGALGDTIAWIPYVEEYRKINNVDVVCYTNHNYLFDKVYPNIIFTTDSDPNNFNDVDKKFKLDFGHELYFVDGVLSPDKWFQENLKFDNHVDKFDYRKHSLQSIAAIILGLPDIEIKPKVNIPDDDQKIKGKYVVVAIQSTAQCKYWNNQYGWERLFDFLGKNGYKIVLIDKFKNFGIPNCYNIAPKSKYVIDRTGNRPLSERITDIKYAKIFISISSGLSWLSWAIGTPTILISGFTKPFNEFKSNVIRIHNSNVCNGCWHDENVTFDAKNWLFCPKFKGFECSKEITPKMVIDEVKKLI